MIQMRSRYCGVLAVLHVCGGCGGDFARYKGDPKASIDDWEPALGGESSPEFDFGWSKRDAGSDVALVNPGGDPDLEVFDPSELYMAGSITQLRMESKIDAASSEPRETGIAPLGRPERAFVGLPEYASNLVIRPEDGRLLYIQTSPLSEPDIRVFHCDGCSQLLPSFGYKSANWKANDGRIATPPCRILLRFQFTPEAGLVYACSVDSKETWFDEHGNQLLQSRTSARKIARFGYAQTVLLSDGVFHLATAEVAPFTGDIENTTDVIASRALSDGYWLVDKGNAARYRVSFAGRAIREGVFRSPVPSSENGQLDAEGNLIVVQAGLIYRARLGGENELLYKPPSETELPTDVHGRRNYFMAGAVFGDLQ